MAFEQWWSERHQQEHLVPVMVVNLSCVEFLRKRHLSKLVILDPNRNMLSDPQAERGKSISL